MTKEKSKVDQMIECYRILKKGTLQKFCDKQKLSVFGFMSNSPDDVIYFSPELRMCFRDIFLDLSLHIEKGIAVRYMQGFDMDLDNAEIDKVLSYKEYLESKKLI